MSFKSRLWNCRPKILEWLILAAVVAILIALVLPQTKWAASGEINVPVLITVFDAQTITPIPEAVVGIVRAPVSAELLDLEYCENVSSGIARLQEFGSTTNEAGQVTIEQRINTGASHKRPVSMPILPVIGF